MSVEKHPFPARALEVIQTIGSEAEIGQQHGEALASSCRVGMPQFYHGLLERMLSRTPQGGVRSLALAGGRALLKGVLIPRLKQRVPLGLQQRVRAMALASGVEPEGAMVALIMTDLMPILQGVLAKALPGRFVESLPAVPFGCSSFLHNGTHFLMGRNLDFPGVAYWDRYPVIQCMAPDRGMRSIAFTSAGVPLAGISGINEAQVAVALHQHYCRDFRFSGTLPFVVAERILHEARSIKDAVGILESEKVSTGWAFVVADGKTREGMVWEKTPRSQGSRALPNKDSRLVHSNYFHTRQCQKSEYATSARMNWDNTSRALRMEALLAQFGEGLTPEQACHVLSDCVDPFWGRQKVLNRTLSQTFNIQSLVLDPERMLAWVAEGDCPIHLGEYHGFDLGEIFAGRQGRTGEVLTASPVVDPQLQKAKARFVQSFVHAMDGDNENAFGGIRASLQASFTPEVALIGAVLSLQAGRFEQADTLLERALGTLSDWLARSDHKRPPPEFFEIELFRARSRDLQGERASAQEIYRSIAKSPELEDAHLKSLARRAGPYTERDLDGLLLPYSTYAPFS